MAQPVPEFYLHAGFMTTPLYPVYHWGAVVDTYGPNASYPLSFVNNVDRTGHTTLASAGVGGPYAGVPGPIPASFGSLFDGVDDHYTIADPSGWIRFTTNFTVEAWVKPDTVVGTDPIVTIYVAAGDAIRLALSGGNVQLSRTNTTPTTSSTTATSPLPVGEWSHVAATYDGANVRLYVNGVLVRTVASTLVPRSGVGGGYIGRDSAGVNFFDGHLAGVNLYASALSDAAIADLCYLGWFDLTDRLRLDASHYWNRGRRRLMERFEAGEAQFVLDNRDGYLDPFNYAAPAPYLNQMVPNVPIEFGVYWAPPGDVRQQWPLWTGFADEWRPEYPEGRDAVVTLTAHDHLKHYAGDGPATPLEAEIRADTPGAWWRFDGYDPAAASPIMSDSTGNNRDGQLPNNLSVAAAVAPFAVGAALVIPTADASYGVHRDPAVYVAPLTITGWILVDPGLTDVGGSLITIVDADAASTGNVDLVYVGFDSFTGPDGGGPNCFLQAVVTSTGGNASWQTSAFTVDDGRPHSFMLSVTSATNWALYVDGAVAAGDAFNNGVAGALTTLDRLAVGALRTDTPANVAVSDLAVYPGVALGSARAAAHHAAGMTGWDGDQSGTRIEKVAALVRSEWWRAIDLGNTPLQGSTLDGSLLEHMQRVAATENGGLWVNRYGHLRFRQRHALFRDARYTTSQHYFGDRGFELRYETLAPVAGYQRLVTKARIARRGGAVQQSENVGARDYFGPRKVEDTDLAMRNDNLATDLANWLVAKFSTPRREFESLILAPGVGDDDVTWAYLHVELEDRITVAKRPPGGGAAIAAEVHVQSDYNTLVRGKWRAQWYLMTADTQQYFTLNDATRGRLNAGYPLAY